jgi:ferrous iron transport protein A
MSAVLSSDFVSYVPLSQLGKGDRAVVVGLADAHGPEQEAVRTRLLELGFAPGEKVRVVALSFPSRDPIAVRVGNTTFALRRHEAALIQVSFHSPLQGEIEPALS